MNRLTEGMVKIKLEKLLVEVLSSKLFFFISLAFLDLILLFSLFPLFLYIITFV